MTDYAEFEGLDEMEEREKAIYLLKLIRRYSDVIKEAKNILEPMVKDVQSKPYDFAGIEVKSRTSTTVDNTMLSVAYPDIYKGLFTEGKLVAKIGDLKDIDPEAYDNIVSSKTSTWLELKG